MSVFAMQFIHQYIEKEAMRLCRETEHCCEKWPDEEVLKNLQTTEEKKIYLSTCHRLIVMMRPRDNGCGFFIKISCREYDPRKPRHCDFTNEEAEKLLERDFVPKANGAY